MIKAVVFDFGNVLYDLNFELFHSNLTTLMEEPLESSYPEFLGDAVKQYDAGDINTETFIWKIQKYKDGNLNPRSIINCWNSLLDGFPAHRWAFLKQVKENYKLFLLSNINELHLEVVYKHIKKIHGKVDFETEYFDAVFYSHLIHMIKPNREIYAFVEDVIGFKGLQILFIDDREENIQAAKAFGWNAELHNPKEDISIKFKEYISKY